MYKHYFRCGTCGQHVVTYTEDSVPWLPAPTHYKALEEGATKAVTNNAGGDSCLGVLSYCSGVLPRTGGPCGLQHRGSVHLQPAPEPVNDPNWDDLVARVTAAWNAFVASNYSPALRGANNTRQYRPQNSVRARLQQAQGVVNIGGTAYTIAPSDTADVALHRPIPAQHQVGYIRSFIFHL
jgi:hypothetical protein